MATRMKELERQAKSYENRWRMARAGNNVGETYAAAQDYKHNIEEQEKELKKLDPNSREYEKAEQSISEQRSKLWDMEYKQKREFSDNSKQNSMRELEAKNDRLSKEMSVAEQKCDVKRYEQLRAQYSKNVNSQDQLSKEMRADGIECRDTVQLQRNDLYGHDIQMRDKLGEKVAEQTAKGKKVSEEDRANAEKYSQQVKKDEVENVKWQGERTVDNMYNRNASEEEIAAQKKKNEENVQYVERINR